MLSMKIALKRITKTYTEYSYLEVLVRGGLREKLSLLNMRGHVKYLYSVSALVCSVWLSSLREMYLV